MTDSPPNIWSFLIAVVTLLGVIGGPVVTWFLTRKQTAAIKADAVVHEQKLDAVQHTVAKTEVLVNGDRAEKQARIASLEARLRSHGLDP